MHFLRSSRQVCIATYGVLDSAHFCALQLSHAAPSCSRHVMTSWDARRYAKDPGSFQLDFLRLIYEYRPIVPTRTYNSESES